MLFLDEEGKMPHFAPKVCKSLIPSLSHLDEKGKWRHLIRERLTTESFKDAEIFEFDPSADLNTADHKELLDGRRHFYFKACEYAGLVDLYDGEVGAYIIMFDFKAKVVKRIVGKIS